MGGRKESKGKEEQMRQIPTDNNRTGGRKAIARRGITARARRRRRRMILFYLFTFFLVIAAAVILSLTVLFRIDTIQVENTSSYSQEEILEACGIQTGENLFLADVDGAQKRVDEKLPLSGGVSVTRKLPATVVITVEEPVVSAAFEQDGKYIVLSNEEKVIQIADTQPSGCPVVAGLTLKDPQAGKKAKASDEKVLAAFEKVTATLEKCQLSDITRIDVTDIYQMMVVYQGRIGILLGTSNDLETKISAAKKIVEQELGEDEKGELDVSLTRDLKKAYYNADSVASSNSSQAESSQESQSSETSSSQTSGDSSTQESSAENAGE